MVRLLKVLIAACSVAIITAQPAAAVICVDQNGCPGFNGYWIAPPPAARNECRVFRVDGRWVAECSGRSAKTRRQNVR